MADARSRLIRLALAATALSMWAYIPYRYSVRPPRFEGVLGSAYAVLFPLAAVLALGALLVAWRPQLLDGLRGGGTRTGALRAGLGLYAVGWMSMGLMCLPMLKSLAVTEPGRGLFATLHMTAQHVFLGLAALAAAWRPDVAAAILGPAPLHPAVTESPLLSSRASL